MASAVRLCRQFTLTSRALVFCSGFLFRQNLPLEFHWLDCYMPWSSGWLRFLPLLTGCIVHRSIFPFPVKFTRGSAVAGRLRPTKLCPTQPCLLVWRLERSTLFLRPMFKCIVIFSQKALAFWRFDNFGFDSQASVEGRHTRPKA